MYLLVGSPVMKIESSQYLVFFLKWDQDAVTFHMLLKNLLHCPATLFLGLPINPTLLIITGRLQVYLQVKTLYFHIQALPRNYIGKCFRF